jgi:triosephosphate isomerase (TIM)
MRRKFLAGNWKMNKVRADLAPFFSALVAEIGSRAKDIDILFATPYTLLDSANGFAKKHGIRIAAQNVHFEKSGAFTGEISCAMLQDLGIGATLIGHSERRQYYNETDASVAKKTKVCLENKITPIVCVGETKQEREKNETEAVVRRQVEAFTAGVDDPKDLVVAYEPVWAIGTGLNATSQQAEAVHAFIRGLLKTRYGAKAETIRILYGGSANPGNFKELISQPNIDGGLVGGASLKPSDFAAMINMA